MNFGAGTRIAADARLARLHVEHAETPQLDPIAVGQGFLHGGEDGLDGHLSPGLGDAGAVNDRINEVELNHCNLLKNREFILENGFFVVKKFFPWVRGRVGLEGEEPGSYNHARMASSEEECLIELWNKRICPFCGKMIREGKAIGSGKLSKGRFCSLDCYTEYHRAEILERARKVQALADRHRNS